MKTLLTILSISLMGMQFTARACTPPAGISGPAQICVGESVTLTDATPGGTWGSSDPTIGIVSTFSGILTGISSGVVTITYFTGVGCYSILPILVNPSPDPIVGMTDVCQTLSTPLTDATPGGTWESDFPGIASVGLTSGVVTGNAPSGGTPIRYILPTGCQALLPLFMHVHIRPAPVTGTSVMCQGDSTVLNIAFPAGGTWSSSTTSVATVTDLGYPFGGQVLGVAGGTSVISYTIVSCPPSTDTITINPLPAPIDGLTSICIGLPITLSDSIPGGTWTSSVSSVATIDASSGVVTVTTTTVGLSTAITYTLPTGCFVNTLVTTNSAPAPITGSLTVCDGSSVTVADATPGGTWSSTALSIAQVVSTSGLVNGISPGTVTISYTLSSGCYAAVPFVVQTPIPAELSLTRTPSGDTLCSGQPVIFRVSAVNAGTPTFQWFRFDTSLSSQVFDTLLDDPMHGDVYICQVVTHNICSVKDTVYDTLALNVFPANITPTISIITSDSSNILAYPGQVITLFSSILYAGPGPAYQWYENGQPVAGATGATFATAVYANDTFYCTVTGMPPCDNTSYTSPSNKIIIYGNYLEAQQVTQTESLALFPNPNNGIFSIAGNLDFPANETGKIDVYDMMGRKVYSGSAPIHDGKVTATLNLEGVPPGIYVLHFGISNIDQTFRFSIN